MSNYKGSREAYAAAMMQLAEEDPRYVAISPDSMKAMRMVGFLSGKARRVQFKFSDRRVVSIDIVADGGIRHGRPHFGVHA